MKSFNLFFLVLPLSLGILGCSPSVPVVHFPDRSFQVEVARTPAQRQRGLMFRDHLDQNKGMLFVFEQEETLSFWMRDTRLPLDIAYLDRDGRIVDIFPLEPFNETPVPSTSPAMYALEVNRGALAGLRRGQRADLSFLRDNR